MNPHSLFNGLYNKPFKIFVTATGNNEKKLETSSVSSRNEFHLPDSKQVYEEVISSTPVVKKTLAAPKRIKKVVKTLNPFNKSQFLKSCQENDLETLSGMDLSDPSNLNATDDFGWNGLMIAACSNAGDVFSYLLSQDINYELTDKSGRSALDFAAKKGHSGITEAFRDFANGQRRECNSEGELTDASQTDSFHCELCGMEFSQTSRASHSTSVLHQFHSSSQLESAHRVNYGISTKNPGYQLMLKQGWETRGLGPEQSGRLYPVKTVLRKPRSGLGTSQRQPERVTHFQPYDHDAVRYRPPERAKGRRETLQDYESERRKERRLRKALS